MPDDSPDSPAPSAVAPPGGSGPPGAVTDPSSGQGGGGAPASPATPPMAGPVAQAVPPRGDQRKILQAGSLIVQGLNKMLGMGINPSDEIYKDIASAIKSLSKHFPTAPSQGGGAQPPMAPRPQGQPQPQPMMSGGPQAAMAQRGPAAMPA